MTDDLFKKRNELWARYYAALQSGQPDYVCIKLRDEFEEVNKEWKRRRK